MIACLLANPTFAETIRVATFAAPLSRDGPGLLLRDINRGEDAQIAATVAVIDQIAPDVLLLTDFDYDQDGLALAAFEATLAQRYPTQFARMSNAGMPTGLDIDGNGRLGDARDGQGYGRFAGDGGMAILTRFAIDEAQVQDFGTMLWADLAGAVLPRTDDGPFFNDEVRETLRLSSDGHWILPVILPDETAVSVMAYAATPPIFDGPEDMNGLRNRDELRLWEAVLDGQFGNAPASFIIAGNANLDPEAGQGNRAAMAAFLARPDLQDPHVGQPNADWGTDGPGQLRVSYLLPSRDWQITDAGVVWPSADDQMTDLLGSDGMAAGPQRLIWVDISR